MTSISVTPAARQRFAGSPRTGEADLNALLAEDLASARERRQTAYDRLTRPHGERILLFGAGGLGRRTLDGLRAKGIEPVAFIDTYKAGGTLDGVPVLSPDEAARRHGTSAAFVVTIWRAGRGPLFGDIRDQLVRLGCQRVVSFLSLYWKYPEVFLPYYGLDVPEVYLRNAEHLRECHEAFADPASRQEFYGQLRWRILGDFDAVRQAHSYTPYIDTGLFRHRDNEVFVDCGAFTGDTIQSFLGERSNVFGHIVGFEPDPANYRKLQETTGGLPPLVRSKIDIYSYAVSKEKQTLRFDAEGLASSRVCDQGQLEVQAIRLDHFLKRPPTLLKMDIEGAEYDALLGAQDSIRRFGPVLGICIYHLPEDLWRIPLLMRSLRPDYRLFLRSHDDQGWDLVAYAVPADRLPES
jgi:FkbM family methyltransferase